jgi:hypothetical protein
MIPYKQIIQEQEEETDFETTFHTEIKQGETLEEIVEDINKKSTEIKWQK